MSDSSTRPVAVAFVDALLRHDQEAAFSMIAPDAPIFVSGRNVLSGSFSSVQHYRQTMNWVFNEHDAGIDVIRCNNLLVDGQTAVALVDERAHRDVGALTYARVMILTIEQEQITSLRLIAEDPYALDAFWE